MGVAEHPYEAVGRRIRLLRAQVEVVRGQRVSQADVAEEVGVAESTVTSWEIGRQRPSGHNLDKLAQLLGSTPDYIMEGGAGGPDEHEAALEQALRDIRGIVDRALGRGASGKAKVRMVRPEDAGEKGA